MAVQAFESSHDDLIHDVSYDFYGKRMATCSSDQRVKVWEYSQENSCWEPVDTWKAHEGSVLKVSWAHPEFGQVIATCSFDRTVRIWEEQEHESRNSGKRWTEKAVLRESTGSVQDVEFAPNYMGLKFATCAADGMLRIYEALEVNNLAQWTLMGEINITTNTAGKESDGHYCLSWCPSRSTTPMIVIGCGKENCAKIFRQDSTNRWQAFEILDGHANTVYDVSWAPSMGRAYHLIATASKDHNVRIFKLVDNKKEGFEITRAPELSDHNVEVWKVEWNVTGTILSSSGDDGKVRLWKCSLQSGEWKCMSTIYYDRQPESMEM
ncbi:9503_t:CDS:2 [Diversispora eburnea]|uniref:9503_t:CDS:1 n=1 Tax=Diversispora eburnea TaxID=1213867 RepID=A0A9N8V2V2_9GLOM|nr:9503_t:CDS:2 [Diversispora eburnea]